MDDLSDIVVELHSVLCPTLMILDTTVDILYFYHMISQVAHMETNDSSGSTHQ